MDDLPDEPGTPDGDAVLVAAVRDGDSDAFGRLFDAWFDRAYDVAWRIVRDRDDAADVAQEALLAGWRNLEGLDDPRAFGGWVLRIARNRALDHHRKHDRTRPVDDEAVAVMEATTGAPPPGGVAEDRLTVADDPARAAEDAELAALVWDAADALGERDASLLDLHLRHGLSPAEIAAEMDLEPNAAHQGLHRLRQRLGAAVAARILWRGGDPSCADLRRLLDDAGSPLFGQETASVVRRHAKSCADCTESERTHLDPTKLFAAIPVAVAPIALKAKAAAAMEAAGVPMSGSNAIGSGSTAATAHPWRHRLLVGAGGLVIVLLVFVAVLAATTRSVGDGEAASTASSSSTSTSDTSTDDDEPTTPGDAGPPAPGTDDGSGSPDPGPPPPEPGAPTIESFALTPPVIAVEAPSPVVTWSVDVSGGGTVELTGPGLLLTSPSGTQSVCPGTVQAGLCVSSPGTYDYVLHAYDTSGAEVDVRTMTVTVQ